MLTITSEATERLKNVIETEKKNWIRLFVHKVGRSDLRLGVKAEEGLNPDDVSLEVNGIKIAIDPASINHLKDATIDFFDDVVGGGFVFENSSPE